MSRTKERISTIALYASTALWFFSPMGCEDSADLTLTQSEKCNFTTSMSYGNIGGDMPRTRTATLSPDQNYTYEVEVFNSGTDNASESCSPPLPICGAADQLSSLEIIAGLKQTDVANALAAATVPLYGVDNRPVDGVVFSFTLEDGEGFLVGGPCGSDIDCVPIPQGIQQFVDLLKALDEQQLNSAECAEVSAL